ncbi:hypothetical protein HanRHA438_Chr04g0185841 [Helianthus annuus]|nr:hypothetical protein HanRHA438_Chr04g0185841 [Helianthus annuus]
MFRVVSLLLVSEFRSRIVSLLSSKTLLCYLNAAKFFTVMRCLYVAAFLDDVMTF